MPEKASSINQDISWDFYSYVILALFTFLQLLHWKLFPKFLDIYYHLSVMSGFADAGGYVTRAFWEYAPVGRPHLYPPLLHILMLFLYKLGLTKLFIARFFSCLIYPLTLSVSWWVTKKIFSPRLAFFVLLVSSTSFGFYISTINLIPFCLCLIFGLLVFLCIEKQRIITATLIMGLGFYTHTQAAGLILLSIILYGILNRIRFNSCVKTAAGALFIASPILFHQLYNWRYFQFVFVMENRNLDINLAIYFLAILGIFLATRYKRAYFIFLCIFMGMLPLCFSHPARYFSGIGLMGLIFLAGLGLDYLFNKISAGPRIFKKFLILSGIVLFFYICSPTLYIEAAKKIRWGLFDTTLANALKGAERKFRSTELSIYYPQYEDKVIKVVEEDTDKDEIICSDLAYFAGLLSVFTGRATSTAMLSEVRPYADFDRIAVSKIIILFKEIDDKLAAPLKNIIERYDLTLIKETEIAYIYLNPQAKAKRIVPRSILPVWTLFLLLFIYLIIILGDVSLHSNSLILKKLLTAAL
ncbi:MAG: hypothetical protein NC829_02080 [Candidatus Omnitrophica bacterium]|nr:hypothetical protein [Candidatus Omnitrophota bacterium]